LTEDVSISFKDGEERRWRTVEEADDEPKRDSGRLGKRRCVSTSPHLIQLNRLTYGLTTHHRQTFYLHYSRLTALEDIRYPFSRLSCHFFMVTSTYFFFFLEGSDQIQRLTTGFQYQIRKESLQHMERLDWLTWATRAS